MKRITIILLLTLCLPLVLSSCYHPTESDLAGKTFLRPDEMFTGENGPLFSFSITFYKDGTFQYYETPISSYLGIGEWEFDGDIVTLSENRMGFHKVNRFRVTEDAIYYVADGSDNFMYVGLENGDKFTLCDLEVITDGIMTDGDSEPSENEMKNDEE